MRQLLRRAYLSSRHRLLAPVMARLDATDQRLDALTAAVEAMRADMERTAARAAGMAELATTRTESALLTARRLERIEDLLGRSE